MQCSRGDEDYQPFEFQLTLIHIHNIWDLESYHQLVQKQLDQHQTDTYKPAATSDYVTNVWFHVMMTDMSYVMTNDELLIKSKTKSSKERTRIEFLIYLKLEI